MQGLFHSTLMLVVGKAMTYNLFVACAISLENLKCSTLQHMSKVTFGRLRAGKKEHAQISLALHLLTVRLGD